MNIITGNNSAQLEHKMYKLKKEIADDKFALKANVESSNVIWSQKKDNKDKTLDLKRNKIEEEFDVKLKYFDNTIKESNEILHSLELNNNDDIIDSKLDIIIKEQEDKKENLEKQNDNKIEILERQNQDIIQQLEKQLQDKKNSLEKQLQDNIQQLKDKLNIKLEAIDSQYNSKIELFKSKVEIKIKTKDSKLTEEIDRKKKYIISLESKRDAVIINKKLQLDLIDNEIQKENPDNKTILTLTTKIEEKEKELERIIPIYDIACVNEQIEALNLRIDYVRKQYDTQIEDEIKKGNTKEWEEYAINKINRIKNEDINSLLFNSALLVKKLESMKK